MPKPKSSNEPLRTIPRIAATRFCPRINPITLRMSAGGRTNKKYNAPSVELGVPQLGARPVKHAIISSGATNESHIPNRDRLTGAAGVACLPWLDSRIGGGSVFITQSQS